VCKIKTTGYWLIREIPVFSSEKYSFQVVEAFLVLIECKTRSTCNFIVRRPKIKNIDPVVFRAFMR
jgi:hypothetical protein